MKKIYYILICMILCATAGIMIQCGVSAETYYVDSSIGNDNNSGLSENEAWKSLEKINSNVFKPGDSVLFRAGEVYNGNLELHGNGEKDNPITVGSYGDGEKPVINGKGSYAILLENLSYWTITGLEITNKSTSGIVSSKSGITAIVNEGYTSYGIRIENNTITQVDGNCGSFDNAGIFCRAIGNFDGLYIADNDIHDIKTIGIYLLSHQDTGITPSYNVHIKGNTITRNGRDGIIVTNAQNALIEYNKLFYIGAMGENLNWIAGIFPTRCTDGIIQFNEVAYIVETGDSYAYDLDVGCTGTFYFQYNYSHDNAGGFYMQPSDTMKNDTDKCIVRYNVSLRERGSFRIQSDHVEVYNNVLYDSQEPLQIGSSYVGGIEDVNFYNNIFVSPGTPEYWPEFTYSSNLYYGHTPPEGHRNSVAADPQFISEVVEKPQDCVLSENSPAVGAGQRSNDASRDYAGNQIFDMIPDIGAFSSDIELINAVRDSSFENDYTAWSLGEPFSVTTDKAYDGTHSLRLSGMTSWNGARQDITLLPNTDYSMEFYVTGNAYTSVRILNWQENILANSGMFLPSGQWEKRTLDFTTDNTGNIRIFVADAGMGTNYFDSFNITVKRTKSFQGDNSVKPDCITFPAVGFSQKSGVSYSEDVLMSCDSGDWVCFSDVKFGTGYNKAALEYAVPFDYAGKNIYLRLDSPDGKIIASSLTKSTGSWEDFQTMTFTLDTVYGTHDLYICFGEQKNITGNFVPETVFGVGNFRQISLY